MAETKANSQSGIFTVAGIFLVAVGLLMLSNGRFPIAVCTWIGPLLMIHLTRNGKGLHPVATCIPLIVEPITMPAISARASGVNQAVRLSLSVLSSPK
jgi:hypothetical protein